MIVLKSSSHLALLCVCEIYIYIKCSSWKSFLTVPLLFILCAEVWSQKNSTSAHIESSLTRNKFKTHPRSFSRTHAASSENFTAYEYLKLSKISSEETELSLIDATHLSNFCPFFFVQKKKHTHRENMSHFFGHDRLELLFPSKERVLYDFCVPNTSVIQRIVWRCQTCRGTKEMAKIDTGSPTHDYHKEKNEKS